MAAGKIMKFGDMKVKPDVRMLRDVKGLLYDKVWASRAADVPLYFMYRDLGLNEKDRALIRENGLRYDITIIPPRMLGVEYVKTAGHYHTKAPGQDVSYPELYYVLEGEVHYLLQKSGSAKTMDVVLIKAKKGDNVLIPPDYGHVAINPSSVELKMANWVCRDFESDYSIYKERRGAAYFELDGGRLVANKNYGSVPGVRFFTPTNYDDFGLKQGKDIYSMVKDLNVLDYLKNPAEYMDLFKLLFTL